MLEINEKTHLQAIKLNAKTGELVFNMLEYLDRETPEAHRLVLENIVDIEEKMGALKIGWGE